MKYVLVIYEGAADVPLDELEGSTPLQLARAVNASALAERGVGGCLVWSSSDRLNRAECHLASVLGLPPVDVRMLRRGPVEAAVAGSGGASWTYAFRGNFVAMDGDRVSESRVSGLSADETKWLTDALAEGFAGDGIRFSVVAEGRLSVTMDRLSGAVDPGAFPEPGVRMDDTQQRVTDRRAIMGKAGEILAATSLNEVRVDLGENPANGLWLWGGGPPVSVAMAWPASVSRALMVTSSPLARGMAALCGMETIALGDIWSETAAPDLVSADGLYQAMLRHDLAVVYVEAPLEGGRYGGGVEKVKAIDRLDIHLLGRLNEVLRRFPEHRLLLAALPEDGVWMEETPVILAGTGVAPDAVSRWNEMDGVEGAMGRVTAHRCLAQLAGE